MSFSIEDFKAAIGRRGGMMRDNRYIMTFTPPPCMRDVRSGLADAWPIVQDVEYWVDSVNIPGYQLALNVTKRWTYGPDEKRPYMPVFLPITVTFNSDADGTYLRFFNDWLQYILPHDWYNGGINQISNYTGRQYEVEYKSEYATDITIAVVNTAGQIVEVYYIKEAFPSLVTDIPMSYSQNGNAKFQVNFEYLDWTVRTDSPAVQEGTAVDTPDPIVPNRAADEPTPAEQLRDAEVLPPTGN